MNLAELRALALSVGFPDPSTAAAVAMAESGGNPCALGDPEMPASCAAPPSGPSTSFGLWQIHVPAHPQYDPSALLDPVYNARAALAISSGGRDWSHWSTFNSGKYAQYLPGGAGAVHAGIGLVAVAVLAGAFVRRLRAPVF